MPNDGPVRRSSLPLITTDDVMAEIHRLFDAGPEVALVIRVHGADDATGGGSADDTFREMLASLRMYDDRYRTGGEQKVTVQHVSVNDGGRRSSAARG